MTTLTRLIALSLLATFIAPLTGCQSAYYGAWEKLGVHKRDILVERVEEARDDQEDAREEFQSALDRFTDVVGFDGGDLRDKYDELNDQLESCQKRADAVHDRVDSVESVATALFREWDDELEQYSDQNLRRRSEESMRATRRRYDDLIGAMRRAESKMAPVLAAFNDQVLFLKHNLNAQAIASLRGEVAGLESDIASLVAEMNAAIAEANEFIAAMESS